MLFRQEGPRLAVVGADNRVQLRPITIGRDYGATLEVLGGVSADDRIIVNPNDSLEDGQPVKVAPDNQEGKHS
jgi:multidrug efflux pump subunit AcrA (membrane-fusion protein)